MQFELQSMEQTGREKKVVKKIRVCLEIIDHAQFN